jgi:hypothetical protein
MSDAANDTVGVIDTLDGMFAIHEMVEIEIQRTVFGNGFGQIRESTGKLVIGTKQMEQFGWKWWDMQQAIIIAIQFFHIARKRWQLR